MKVVDKFLDIMGFTEAVDDMPEENNTTVEISEWKARKPKPQVVSTAIGKEQTKVVLLEPISFDDCQQIADNMKNKRTVLINVENLEVGLARRIIDFVGGTAYALGGTLQKVGVGIIIAAPHNVDISGDIHNLDQPKEVFAWINKIQEASEVRRY